MTVKDLIDVAQFALNVLLACFTLILFRQGQKDRRRVTEDREREQASKISIFRRELTKPSAGGGWSVLGVNLEIRNDSDLPITSVRVLKGPTRLESADQVWEAIKLGEDPRSPDVPGGESRTFPCGPELVVGSLELHFVDGAGRAWVRRESDGTLWPNEIAYKLGRWWQVWYHRMAVGRFSRLFNWPTDYALRRTAKVAPRIPIVARVARFLWGSATPAAPDPEPWRRPWKISERDWPYQNLISFALQMRDHDLISSNHPGGADTTSTQSNEENLP